VVVFGCVPYAQGGDVVPLGPFMASSNLSLADSCPSAGAGVCADMLSIVPSGENPYNPAGRGVFGFVVGNVPGAPISRGLRFAVVGPKAKVGA
jgi:hypothetical protein